MKKQYFYFSKIIKDYFSNTETARRVDSAFSQDDDLKSASSIIIEAENGTVTLSGIVPNPSILHAAYEIAVSTTGVTNVKNHLIIVK
jgi:osmotically-inducible protein OsmY